MDFNMFYVDHRNVVFGEQEWQDSIAITSKFIAYSGAELKQDSLLVYYSIDGGEYQTAAMTATGNPDEYVGYIKGYQAKSEVKYYVFGADESDRRYQQPVFGELDPHVFTMGEHTEATLTLNPTEIVFDDNSGDFVTMTITNNTANEVVVNSISVKNDLAYHAEHDFALPYTLSVGESVEIEIYCDFAVKGEFDSELYITSSLGEQIVPIIWNCTIGLEENKNNFVIYPNPVKDVVMIQGNSINEISVYNSIGVLVERIEGEGNEVEINMNNYNTGIYFVQVNTENGTATRKVVKL